MKFVIFIILFTPFLLQAKDNLNVIVIMADDLGYHDLGF